MESINNPISREVVEKLGLYLGRKQLIFHGK
jgi:hypothetical protein